MAVEFYEHPDSRELTLAAKAGEHRKIYVVLNTANEYVAQSTALSNIPPADDGGYLLHDMIVRPETAGPSDTDCSWKVEAVYSHPESEDGEGESYFVGLMDWATTSGVQNGRAMLAIKQTEFPGAAENDDTFVGRGIEVVDGGEIRGLDIQVPALELRIWRIWPRTSWKGATGIANVKALTGWNGSTNNAPWWGFERGELLFLGIGEPEHKVVGSGLKITKVTYRFECQANRANIDLGVMANGFGVNVPLKRGHEYLWTYARRQRKVAPPAAGGADEMVTRPWRVYVAQVYPELDFSLLGLGNAPP